VGIYGNIYKVLSIGSLITILLFYLMSINSLGEINDRFSLQYLSTIYSYRSEQLAYHLEQLRMLNFFIGTGDKQYSIGLTL